MTADWRSFTKSKKWHLDVFVVDIRELPADEDREARVRTIAARAGLGRSSGLLPSDIVFTEPPPAPERTSS